MKLISNKDYNELLETIDSQKNRIAGLLMEVYGLKREVARLKADRLADPDIPEDRIEPYE